MHFRCQMSLIQENLHSRKKRILQLTTSFGFFVAKTQTRNCMKSTELTSW